MLYLSYDEPIDQSNLPALNASFDRLKLRIRRRRILSGVCGCLCFLLFSAMMILGSVGAFHRFAGTKYAAALDSLPYVKKVLTAAFQTLPALLGLKLELTGRRQGAGFHTKKKETEWRSKGRRKRQSLR